VAYPTQNVHADIHDYLFDNNQESDLPRSKRFELWKAFAQPRNLALGDPQKNTFSEDDQNDLWHAYASAKGVSVDVPPKRKANWSIFTQFIQAGIAAPVGLISLFSWLSSFRRWIRSDETKIETHSGQEVAYTDITTLDKQRWKTKGIAVVNYRNEKGQGKIILDDWKFDRAATEKVLRDVEAHLDDHQIVNGEREPDYEALAAEDAQRLAEEEDTASQAATDDTGHIS